jgi:hypothetical protein
MMFSWDWRAGAAFAGVLSGGLLLAITAQAADLPGIVPRDVEIHEAVVAG